MRTEHPQPDETPASIAQSNPHRQSNSHYTRPWLGAEFNPIAERTGLIEALTDWVMGAVIEASQQLQQSGAILRLAANLSAHDVMRPVFPPATG